MGIAFAAVALLPACEQGVPDSAEVHVVGTVVDPSGDPVSSVEVSGRRVLRYADARIELLDDLGLACIDDRSPRECGRGRATTVTRGDGDYRLVFRGSETKDSFDQPEQMALTVEGAAADDEVSGPAASRAFTVRTTEVDLSSLVLWNPSLSLEPEADGTVVGWSPYEAAGERLAGYLVVFEERGGELRWAAATTNPPLHVDPRVLNEFSGALSVVALSERTDGSVPAVHRSARIGIRVETDGPTATGKVEARPEGDEPIELVVVRGCAQECTVEATTAASEAVTLGPVVPAARLAPDPVDPARAWVGCGGPPSGSPCYKTPGFGIVTVTSPVAATAVRVTQDATTAVPDATVAAWPALAGEAPPIERVDPGDVRFLGGFGRFTVVLIVAATVLGVIAAVVASLLLGAFRSSRDRRQDPARVPRPEPTTIVSLVAQGVVAVELLLIVALGAWVLASFVVGDPAEDPFLLLLLFVVPAMIAAAIVAALLFALVVVAGIGVAARWRWARVMAIVVHAVLVGLALVLQLDGDAESGESILGGVVVAAPAGLAAGLLLTASVRDDFARAAAHRAQRRRMRLPGTIDARAV